GAARGGGSDVEGRGRGPEVGIWWFTFGTYSGLCILGPGIVSHFLQIRLISCKVIVRAASFLCTKARMVRVADELFGWHSQDLLASSRHRSMHLLARPGGAVSTISTVAKPRTAIVRDIIVSVGICVRNSIICPPG